MTNRFSPAVPLICVIISFCISCKKSNSGSNAGDDFAAQSHPSPVNTTIGVYAYNNDQASNPLQVINYGFSTSTDVVYNAIYDGFFAGPVTVDKDLSHFGFKPTILYNDPGFWQYKAFNVSSEVKNYVGFKMLNFVNTGNVRNLGGPYTLNLPGNGTLVFPYKAFDDTFGIDINYNILVNYLDPTSNDFVVSLPSLSNADDRGYKWFLNSYGIYQI